MFPFTPVLLLFALPLLVAAGFGVRELRRRKHRPDHLTEILKDYLSRP